MPSHDMIRGQPSRYETSTLAVAAQVLNYGAWQIRAPGNWRVVSLCRGGDWLPSLFLDFRIIRAMLTSQLPRPSKKNYDFAKVTQLALI